MHGAVGKPPSQIGLFALTEDAAEGQLAFREKRKPGFIGR